MFVLPNHVLEKLKCVKCGGYLRSGAIFINQDSEQICGRCFKILPGDVKTGCVRASGLEAVAEILTFPSEEDEISYRHPSDSLSIYNNNNQMSNVYTHQSTEVEMKVHCSNTYNLQDDDQLKLNVELTGKSPNKLHLGSSRDNVKLKLEFMVSSDGVPAVTYGHVFVDKQPDEPVYDTVYMLHSVKCTNCQKNIVRTEIFHCPFGHTLCKLCRNNICVICGALPNSGSQYYCRNYIKGCTNLFPTCDIGKHEIDCEFNDIKCQKCDFVDFLENLISHFVQEHDVICSNELAVSLTRKDQEWYFYCHSKLFHCKYYNFDSFVEFIVIYIGSNDNATRYKYEVSLSENNKDSKKISKCLGWNEVSLEKGLSFELANNMRKNFRASILIL